MEINTLASGSKGNAYVISQGPHSLLLECGIPIDKIKKGTGYRLTGFDGCLLSHEHKDHSKGAAGVMDAGVDLYCSQGTAAALGLGGHRLNTIKSGAQFSVGPWVVLPFETEHDAAEALGFLVAIENEKLLFATDTFYLRQRFSGLTRILIECNYALDTLDENIADGYFDISRKNRLLRSHMSLEQCKSTLAANDLSSVLEIHLIHLSFLNSDAERFRREVMQITGKPTYIAGQ